MTVPGSVVLPLPEDVDVHDMPHMPLFLERLQKSSAWRRARNWRGDGPGLGFALVNLWSYAFRGVPAASIADDEEELAEAAQVSIDHWPAMRARALEGWQLIGARWWHPVVAEIAWRLWSERLEHRHLNDMKRWRQAAKRNASNGTAPPPKPSDLFEAWLGETFPATAAYRDLLTGRVVSDTNEIVSDTNAIGSDTNQIVPDTGGGVTPGVSDTHATRVTHTPLKQSKGKYRTPCSPPVRGGEIGLELAVARAGPKVLESGAAWHEAEKARLLQVFGPMARIMMSELGGGQTGQFQLVHRFADCWIEPGRGGAPGVIVVPSLQRIESLKRDCGEWLFAHWPGLQLRLATTDELRARKRAGEPKGHAA